jgi:LuxR family transcriptional regulator, maltose regulon positive regulatory protein
MTTTVLATKLFVPLVPRQIVVRPRLLAKLRASAGQRLVLVSAPAGYGKTTLLGEWLRADELSAAWVALDPRDDHPEVFWSYVVAALEGRGVADLVRTRALLDQASFPEPELLATTLCNDLLSLANPLVLVLDDLHDIASPQVHLALELLVERAPRLLRWVIATREDPPLPLARWRARQQLCEIREGDLSFTDGECQAMLNEALGLALSSEDVSQLRRRTEGWAAGLQMAGLSLNGRPDAHEFVASFSGSQRHVLDFLCEEVLNRQTKEVQEFLLQTSLLERMCGPLCNALTGRADGQALLERLERANLFMVPLDDHREWYRYHALFADLLRLRLTQRGADTSAELHRRASAWLEGQDAIDDAVHHSLAARDYETAARLAQAHWARLLRVGSVATMRRWVESLPRELVLARPRLCIAHAWALVLLGELQAAETCLDIALPVVSEDPALRNLLAEAQAVQAFAARVRGQWDRTVELANLSLSNLPPGSTGTRSAVVYSLGYACLARGEMTAAEDAFRRAEELGSALPTSHVVMPAVAALALVYTMGGQLGWAEEALRRGLAFEAAQAEQPVVAAAEVRAAMAEWHYEHNELAEAAASGERGLELARLWGNSSTLVLSRLVLARVRWASADLDGALTLLREAGELAQRMQVNAMVRDRLDAARLWRWAVEGDLDTARRYVIARALPTSGAYAPLEECTALAAADAWLALGEHVAALDIAQRVMEGAARQGRHGRALEARLRVALALAALGRIAQAREAIGPALEWGAAHGYLRTFTDLGAPMSRLLGQIGRCSPAVRAYVVKLLAVLEPEPVGAPPQDLDEPLTDQERRILRLLAAGMSNKAIASELYLAENTVKWYLKAIYGKLGVSSRVEAAARARELG